MIDWFRSWHGAPTDPKWLLIAKRAGVAPGIVSAIVWALFDHASQEDERGSVADFDAETYAVFSGFDEEQVRAVIAALEAKGIIVSGRIAQWEKRQPKREETSSPRVAKHRQRTDAEPTLPLEPAAEPASPRAPTSARESDAAPAREDAVDAEDDVPPAEVPAPSSRAIQLADAVAIAAGHDLKFVPPTWCGAALRVEMWLSQGWQPPLILESVKAQMTRKRDGPPGSIRYFEKGIARAHADGDAPLPIVQQVEQETIHAGNRNGSGGFGRLARALAAEDDDRAAGGRPPPQLRVVDG